MKKIIPLVVVAIAAFFLLSGCDAMLKAIYPDQVGGDNTIQIQISSPYYSTAWYYAIDVVLYDSAGAYVGSTVVYASTYDGYYYNATVTFNNLKDDYYYAFVWSDANGNSVADGGESQGGTGYSYTLSGGQTDYLYVTLY
jgi:uncharacterized membrane protein YgcG